MQSRRNKVSRWISVCSSILIMGYLHGKHPSSLPDLPVATRFIADLGLSVYLVYTVMPSQRRHRFHAGICLLILFSFILQMAGTFASITNHSITVFSLLTLQLITGLILLKSAIVLIHEKNQPSIILMPFLFHLSWLIFFITRQAVVI